MAYRHRDIQDIIYRSRIRTAAEDAIKSMFYENDPSIENFIQSVCEIADDRDAPAQGRSERVVKSCCSIAETQLMAGSPNSAGQHSTADRQSLKQRQ